MLEHVYQCHVGLSPTACSGSPHIYMHPSPRRQAWTMKVPLATLRRPLLEGSCCVQADRLVSSECVHVDLVLKSASLSLESSKGLAVIPSPREVDGQKEAPTQQSGGAMQAAGTSHTLHACQSARTGTSNTAQRHHVDSSTCVSSSTACSG